MSDVSFVIVDGPWDPVGFSQKPWSPTLVVVDGGVVDSLPSVGPE